MVQFVQLVPLVAIHQKIRFSTNLHIVRGSSKIHHTSGQLRHAYNQSNIRKNIWLKNLTIGTICTIGTNLLWLINKLRFSNNRHFVQLVMTSVLNSTCSIDIRGIFQKIYIYKGWQLVQFVQLVPLVAIHQKITIKKYDFLPIFVLLVSGWGLQWPSTPTNYSTICTICMIGSNCSLFPDQSSIYNNCKEWLFYNLQMMSTIIWISVTGWGSSWGTPTNFLTICTICSIGTNCAAARWPAFKQTKHLEQKLNQSQLSLMICYQSTICTNCKQALQLVPNVQIDKHLVRYQFSENSYTFRAS